MQHVFSMGGIRLEAIPTRKGRDTQVIHPIRVLRFSSFRTQPLESLTPLPRTNNNFLGNPTLGENLGT